MCSGGFRRTRRGIRAAGPGWRFCSGNAISLSSASISQRRCPGAFLFRPCQIRCVLGVPWRGNCDAGKRDGFVSSISTLVGRVHEVRPGEGVEFPKDVVTRHAEDNLLDLVRIWVQAYHNDASKRRAKTAFVAWDRYLYTKQVNFWEVVLSRHDGLYQGDEFGRHLASPAGGSLGRDWRKGLVNSVSALTTYLRGLPELQQLRESLLRDQGLTTLEQQGSDVLRRPGRTTTRRTKMQWISTTRAGASSRMWSSPSRPSAGLLGELRSR